MYCLKHLYLTLDNFIKTSDLTSWNIHSNSKVACVTIRFRLDTDEDTSKEVGLDTNIKYKRVPDGQQKRDMARAKSWKEKANPEMNSSEQPEDKNHDKPKSVVAISSSQIADLPTMS